MADKQCGGCGCSMGGGKRKKTMRRRKVGGTMIGDALLAGTAVGLYSYFTRKRGGKRALPRRRTRRGYV
jgi:hypothetical protein